MYIYIADCINSFLKQDNGEDEELERQILQRKPTIFAQSHIACQPKSSVLNGNELGGRSLFVNARRARLGAFPLAA